MSSVPYIPESAPFDEDQRAWLNGFVAGLLSRREAVAVDKEEKTPLLILFGSQSGTAEGLAKKLNKEAKAKGLSSRVCGMDEVEVDVLKEEQNLLVVTSTWGEGEMPDNAAGFWDNLNQNGSSPELNHLNFAVLALGDTNYTDTFCLAGKQLDARFEELGARRLHPRVDCDVEYDEPAARWTEGVFQALGEAPSTGAAPVGGSAIAVEEATGVQTAPPSEKTHSRKNPFPAPLIASVELAAKSSGKDTRHFEFSLEGSSLTYEAGDALGLFAHNCPDVVDEVIKNHDLDAREVVETPSDEKLPLWDALTRCYEIRQLIGVKAPAESGAAFVEGLRKLQPRLYSIASSPLAHPGEVHLCVDVVRYEIDGRM
ncbi:MAG: sulfite reductase flavoprotein subunit alpha, partial [Verrucomicrobiota bacterium]